MSPVSLTLQFKRGKHSIFILGKPNAKITDIKRELAQVLTDRAGEPALPGMSPPSDVPEINAQDVRVALYDSKTEAFTELIDDKQTLGAAGIKDGATFGYTTSAESEFNFDTPEIQPVELEP